MSNAGLLGGHVLIVDDDSAFRDVVLAQLRRAGCTALGAASYEEGLQVFERDPHIKLVILDHPTSSPFGNPIPGLAELGNSGGGVPTAEGRPLGAVAGDESTVVTVVRIAEPLQADDVMMARLRELGAVPGGTVEAVRVEGAARLVGADGAVDLTPAQARQVIVAGVEAG